MKPKNYTSKAARILPSGYKRRDNRDGFSKGVGMGLQPSLGKPSPQKAYRYYRGLERRKALAVGRARADQAAAEETLSRKPTLPKPGWKK